jgi:hypothetical protein
MRKGFPLSKAVCYSWCLVVVACSVVATQTVRLRGPAEYAGYNVIVRDASGTEVKSFQLSDSSTASFEMPLEREPRLRWLTFEAVAVESGGSMVRFGAGSGVVFANERGPVTWVLVKGGGLDYPSVTWRVPSGTPEDDAYLDQTSVGTTPAIMNVTPKRRHVLEWRSIQHRAVLCASTDSLDSGMSRCYVCNPSHPPDSTGVSPC